jgi:hypothetical protein
MAALADPAIDEAHVGSSCNAQLDGTLVRSRLWPRVVLCQALARVLGQQVRPPGSDLGELSECGNLALRGGRPINGIPTAYVRDLRQQMVI